MLTFHQGDILASGAEVLVCPVNCEGVVGDDAAGAFKRAFPNNHRVYAEACAEGTLHPGNVLVTQPEGTTRSVLYAADREEFLGRSDMDWVAQAAGQIRTFVEDNQPKSVAISALATGRHRLPWLAVRDLLEQQLQWQPMDVKLFLPDVHRLPPLDQTQYAANCFNHDGGPSSREDYSLVTYIRNSREDDAREEYTRKVGCYHPSGVSMEGCDRALAYERLGVPPKPVPTATGPGVNVFDLGDAIHDAIQTRLGKVVGKHGQKFESEVEISYEPLGLYGHADGVFGRLVVEIKSVSKNIFEGLTSPMPSHVRQVHCYMLALDIPHAVLLYVCRDNGAFMEFPLHFSQQVIARITTTIHNVESKLRLNLMPEREPNGFICSRCKYLYTCNPDLAKNE